MIRKLKIMMKNFKYEFGRGGGGPFKTMSVLQP
jgi:hypothetical protein